MKKAIVLLAAMISLSTSAQKKWTLEDCINYAIENNISLKKSELGIRTATETLK